MGTIEYARAARDLGQDPPSQRPREQVRVARAKQQLQFQVRSTEGDTVSLSANALQEVAVARAAAAGSGTGGATQRTVELTGPLSESVFQDIQKALIDFTQGENGAASSSFDYSEINSMKRASSPGESPQK